MTDSLAYVAIGYLLSREQDEQILALNSYLVRCGSWYVLEKHKFPPHITVWIGYVPMGQLVRLVAAAEETVDSWSFPVIHYGPIRVEGGKYFYIGIRESEGLRSQHIEMLTTLNRYRQGRVAEKYAFALSQYTHEERESIRQWGNPRSGVTFRGHVTLGILNDGDEAVISKLPDVTLEGGRITLSKLVVFRAITPGREVEIIKDLAVS